MASWSTNLAITIVVIAAAWCLASAFLRHPPSASSSILLPRRFFSPDEKFSHCCSKIPLKEQTTKDACHFPPKLDLSYDDRLDIAAHFNPYIGCYTNHKDNRDCCIRGGVIGDFKVCQDFCDGTHKHEPTPDHYVCVSARIEKIISDCNKAAYGPGDILKV